MAQLIVLKQNQRFAELKLEDGHEYLVGRQPQCHIYLDEESGISRKHLRIFQENDIWVVECLSRLANLKMNGEMTTQIYLEGDCEFQVGGFDFQFKIKSQAADKLTSNSNEESQVENEFEHEASENALVAQSQSGRTPAHIADESAGTHVLSSNLKAFLNIKGLESGRDMILELEGNLWVGGRDPICEIHIDDSHASRKHFEISRVNHEFFVTDLDSVNGTDLNDQKLVPHKATKILSGDVIKIQNVKLQFEVRDANFEQKFEQAKKQLMFVPTAPLAGPHHPMYGHHYNEMMPLPPPDFSHGGVIEEETPAPFDWRNINKETIKNFDYKKHKVRLLLVALVPILLIGLLGEKKETPLPDSKDSASQGPSYDSLTEEQRTAVKDLFNLAQQHFHTLKYELCLAELNKLHMIIPNYENSKKLQGFCEQGAILLRQEEDRIAKEKRQAETEQRILTTVEYCQTQPQATLSIEAAQSCLQEALELAPEHPAVVNFLDEIRRREEAVVDEKERQAQAQALKAKGASHFRRANDLVNKNSLSQALKEFQSFLSANYPGLQDEKQQATRKLASVKSMLEEKVNKLIGECEALRANSKFKEAWMACDQATKEDPDNQRAASLKKQALSDLRTEMKSIYQDSILEESLGNVDAAKEKWRLIQKNNLEFDDYYKKATRKLQKYGEGI